MNTHIETRIEPKVAVIGVGGAGCNVVSDIFWTDDRVDTIAINTDRDALHGTFADRKLYICKEVTRGEGTKGDNHLGRKCAKIHADEIADSLNGYDVAFIVAGLGGGTGSGASPFIADIAERLNIITFSILIAPFSFEAGRQRTAAEGIVQMKAICRMTSIVENDRAMQILPDATMDEAFGIMNASIRMFVEKNTDKVMQAFREQLRNIGDMVTDRSAIPMTETEWVKTPIA